MSKAGYCSECGTNVWLTAEGGCASGHGVESISGAYDPAPASVAPTVTKAVAPTVTKSKPKTPIHKRKWLLPVAILLAGIFIGSAFASPSPDAVTTGSDSAALTAKMEALEADVEALTTERDLLKEELAPYQEAAEAKAAEEAAAEKKAADEVAAAEKAAADEEAAAKLEEERAVAAAAAAKEAAAEAAKTAAAAAAAKAAQSAAAAAAAPAPSSGGGTVYVTNTGAKYHKSGCGYLSQSKIAISLSSA